VILRRVRVTIFAVEKQYVLSYECLFLYSCISYPARKSHFSTPYYIVMCGLSGSTTFFHVISQKTRFSIKALLNIKCVLWYSLQLLSQKLLILSIIQRDISIKLRRFTCKVPVIFYQILIKLEFCQQIFEKFSNTKFRENPSQNLLILSIIQRDISIKLRRSTCKVSVIFIRF